jgi:hypothetical protein
MSQNEPIPAETMRQIEAELYAGNTVAAIKLHHASAGTGLAEAKGAIEIIDGKLRREFPERFASSIKIPPQMSSLLLVAMLAIGILGAKLLWASYTRNTDQEHRYQHLFGPIVLVMCASYTCIYSLQPKKRILSWVFLGVTILLALAMMYRSQP